MRTMASYDLSKHFSTSNSLDFLTNLVCWNMFITLPRMYAVFNLLIPCIWCLLILETPVQTWWYQWPEITLIHIAMKINSYFFCVYIYWNVWKLAVLSLIDYLTFTCSYSNIILESHINTYFQTLELHFNEIQLTRCDLVR